MKSLADQLPPEIARQIHSEWRRNEATYWSLRAQLLDRCRGQWIGFADGAVIVAASTPLEVFLEVQRSDRHPFVIRVGHEDEPWYRIRLASFSSGGAVSDHHVRQKELRTVSYSPGASSCGEAGLSVALRRRLNNAPA